MACALWGVRWIGLRRCFDRMGDLPDLPVPVAAGLGEELDYDGDKDDAGGAVSARIHAADDVLEGVGVARGGAGEGTVWW